MKTRKPYAEQIKEAWDKISQLKYDYNNLKYGRYCVDEFGIRKPIYKVRVNDTTFHVQTRPDAEFLMLCLKQALPLANVDIHKNKNVDNDDCNDWVKVA